TLWLSDVFNQNDPSELRHGVKHAIKLLREACCAELPEIGMFCDQIEAVLTANIEQSIHLLICCFSTNWDDLGQWRAYADNGKGFAIGFDAEMLDRCFMADQSGFSASSFHIDYDETSLTALQTKIVGAVLPLISLPRGLNLSDDQLKAFITRLSIYFSNQIICAALFFKHRGYVNEAEFRLLRSYPVTSEIPGVLYR
ncbi:DUF2971 domain-containing protein, partial [Enterococcus faecalis]|uniref:DUF2971 domain-containing protein n=1 Tax=Enterococcus faecalis TaxID=1351 RepID=UPI0034E3D581